MKAANVSFKYLDTTEIMNMLIFLIVVKAWRYPDMIEFNIIPIYVWHVMIGMCNLWISIMYIRTSDKALCSPPFKPVQQKSPLCWVRWSQQPGVPKSLSLSLKTSLMSMHLCTMRFTSPCLGEFSGQYVRKNIIIHYLQTVKLHFVSEGICLVNTFI